MSRRRLKLLGMLEAAALTTRSYDSLSVSDHSLERLGGLRATFGASEDLVNLTDFQMREMRARRYAR